MVTATFAQSTFVWRVARLGCTWATAIYLTTMAARVRALTGLLTALSASAASPFAPNGLMLPGAFESYLCQPILADSKGAAWAFDMTRVSSRLNYSDHGFTFAPCGVSSIACVPDAGDAVLQTYSPATQVLSGPPGGQCPNPATGGMSPCSGQCKPAAQGAPSWALLDATNASKGITLTFAGVKPSPDDIATCGHDPVTGAQVRTPAIDVFVYATPGGMISGRNF